MQHLVFRYQLIHRKLLITNLIHDHNFEHNRFEHFGIERNFTKHGRLICINIPLEGQCGTVESIHNMNK